MSAPFKINLILLSAVTLASPCAAQKLTDLSEKPLKTLSRQELDRREAIGLYGLAAQHEQKSRLPEALRVYEQALRLDADSAAIRRALVPLYLALDRQEEALDACKRVVELEPEDFDTWLTYGRQLKSLDRDADARKALLRASECKGLVEQPETQLQVLYELGLLHQKAKAHRDAETTYRQVVAILERPGAGLEQGGMSREELSNQVADLYERIGRVCIDAKQVERAVEAFRNAQKSDPTRAGRLSFNLAEVMVSLKRDVEALRYLDQYLARQPQGIEGYELKLALLRRLGQSSELLPSLKKHALDDPYNNDLQLLLARECQKAGKRDEAEGVYRQLLTTPSIEVYRGLFSLYHSEGEQGAKKLFEILNKAVTAASPDKKDTPADADAATRARAMLGALREDRELVKALLPVALQRILNGSTVTYKMRVFLASMAERTELLDIAEKMYRSCLDNEGKVKEFGVRRQSEAEVYGGLLRVLNHGRRHEDIIKLCKQGLDHAEATNRVLFHLDLSLSLLALGRDKEAVEAVNAAVDTAADSADFKDRLSCRRTRAWLMSQLDRHKDAVQECLDLLKEYTDDKDLRSVRLALSSIYSHGKEHDKAEEQLQKLLDADALDAHALNDLGYLWADQNKKLDEAERMTRKAIELDRQQRRSNSKDSLGLDADRDNAAYVDSLGWVLFRRGRFQEARKELEKASKLPDGKHDPVVWDHLGDTYQRLKEKAKATEAWKKSLQLHEKRHRAGSDERCRDIQSKLKGL